MQPTNQTDGRRDGGSRHPQSTALPLCHPQYCTLQLSKGEERTRKATTLDSYFNIVHYNNGDHSVLQIWPFAVLEHLSLPDPPSHKLSQRGKWRPLAGGD